MSAELEKGLVSMLTGTSPQTLAENRIQPYLDQGIDFPAILYQRIYTRRNQSLDSTVGVTGAMFQVDCIAHSASEAYALGDQVRTILHGYTGPWGTLIARMVDCSDEGYRQDIDGDRKTHRIVQRYMVYTNMD